MFAALCALCMVWTGYHVYKALNLRAAVEVALQASAPDPIAIGRLDPAQFDPILAELAVTQADQFFTGSLAERHALLLLTTTTDPGVYVAFTTLISGADRIDTIFERLAVEGQSGVVRGVVDQSASIERQVRELLEQEGLPDPRRVIIAEPFFEDRLSALSEIRRDTYLNPLIAFLATLVAAFIAWFKRRRMLRIGREQVDVLRSAPAPKPAVFDDSPISSRGRRQRD